MRAFVTKIYDFFKLDTGKEDDEKNFRTGKRSLKIPLYQREYKWENEKICALISDIKKLFLFEASMIGLIGGALGIGLSYLASYLMNKYSVQIGSALGIGTGGTDISVIPLWLVAVALGFAMLVGIISGYYPARRATKIKALEAIRESN